MIDIESVNDFFSKVFQIINQIRSYRDIITNEKVVEKILTCVLGKFEPLVKAIEKAKYLNLYSMDRLFRFLKVQEKNK